MESREKTHDRRLVANSIVALDRNQRSRIEHGKTVRTKARGRTRVLAMSFMRSLSLMIEFSDEASETDAGSLQRGDNSSAQSLTAHRTSEPL